MEIAQRHFFNLFVGVFKHMRLDGQIEWVHIKRDVEYCFTYILKQFTIWIIRVKEERFLFLVQDKPLERKYGFLLTQLKFPAISVVARYLYLDSLEILVNPCFGQQLPFIVAEHFDFDILGEQFAVILRKYLLVSEVPDDFSDILQLILFLQ